MPESAYNLKYLRLIIQLSRPIFLLSAALLYFLGIGIAHYVNGQIDWLVFFFGFAWIILTILGFTFLGEYFDIGITHEKPGWWHTPFSGGSGAIGTTRIPRQAALWAGLTCLTIVASLTVLLYQTRTLIAMAVIMLGLIFLTEIASALPPMRLISSGYGEIVISISRVGFIPALAYALQGYEMHRLLIMVSFPLVILHLAMLLAMELPVFATDIKLGKRPLLVRIGWQRAMLVHNLLVLGGFVVLAIAFMLGLPFSVGWPALIMLPVGFVQVWMMNRIADGAKPDWNLLVLTALATFGMTAYLLTFAFWTN